MGESKHVPSAIPQKIAEEYGWEQVVVYVRKPGVSAWYTSYGVDYGNTEIAEAISTLFGDNRSR